MGGDVALLRVRAARAGAISRRREMHVDGGTMLLTFQADEIRLQVAHAARAAQHGSIAGQDQPPALDLVKKGATVCLVSNGAPPPAGAAYAEGFGPKPLKKKPAAAPGEIDDLGPGDFLESIPIESFAKTLASDREQVRVVVRSTYINVLGGQPERPVLAGVRPRAPGARSW